MKLLVITTLSVIGCFPLGAQPTIVAGPVYNPHDISHSMARVGMVTNVIGRRAVEFGKTPTPDATWRRRHPDGSTLYDKHEWFIDGLAGSTLYYWRMCVGQDTYTTGVTIQVSPANTVTRAAHGFVNGDLIMLSANTSATSGQPTGTLYNLGNNVTYFVINATANTFQLALTSGGPVVTITGSLTGFIRLGAAVCSAPQTLTTQADGPVHPNPPAEVTLTSPDASPTITGTTYAFDSNCLIGGVNLQTFLNTTIAGLTGSTNVAITLPDGADCRGAFSFPSRAHTGWVVVKPDSAATHPPERVRTTPAFRAAKPKLTNNLAPIMLRTSSTGVHTGACGGVGEIHMANNTNQYDAAAPGISNLYNCIATTGVAITKTITAIAGTTLTTALLTVPAHGWESNVGYVVLIDGTGDSDWDAVNSAGTGFPLLVVDANTLKVHTSSTNTIVPCATGTCGTITLRANKPPLANSFGPIGSRPAEPCTNGTLYSIMDVAAPLETTPLNTVDVCRNNAWVRMRYAFGGINAASIPGVSVDELQI